MAVLWAVVGGWRLAGVAFGAMHKSYAQVAKHLNQAVKEPTIALRLK